MYCSCRVWCFLVLRLLSVAVQDKSLVEIIVVDAGCKDNTMSAVASLKLDVKIRCIPYVQLYQYQAPLYVQHHFVHKRTWYKICVHHVLVNVYHENVGQASTPTPTLTLILWGARGRQGRPSGPTGYIRGDYLNKRRPAVRAASTGHAEAVVLRAPSWYVYTW